jgi:hypothetical protein
VDEINQTAGRNLGFRDGKLEHQLVTGPLKQPQALRWIA